jgi:hypothetical protein
VFLNCDEAPLQTRITIHEQYKEPSQDRGQEWRDHSNKELIERHGALSAELSNLIGEESRLVAEAAGDLINMVRMDAIHSRQGDILIKLAQIERELSKNLAR